MTSSSLSDPVRFFASSFPECVIFGVEGWTKEEIQISLRRCGVRKSFYVTFRPKNPSSVYVTFKNVEDRNLIAKVKTLARKSEYVRVQVISNKMTSMPVPVQISRTLLSDSSKITGTGTGTRKRKGEDVAVNTESDSEDENGNDNKKNLNLESESLFDCFPLPSSNRFYGLEEEIE